MKIGAWVAIGVAACAGAVAAPLVFGGCSGLPVPPAFTGGGGGACAIEAGAYPPPRCDDTMETCMAPDPACPTAPCNASSPCLAMADNTGQPVDNLRLRKLNLVAPAALAQRFIQETVIDQGINLDSLCGEGGDGSFSWLIQLDPSTGQLVTGGAPPTADPFNVGYCFVDSTVTTAASGSGPTPSFVISPVTVRMTQAIDGSWTSDVIPKLLVPIYVHGDLNNVVVLPLTNTTLTGVTLSADGNCIGAYNPDGVVLVPMSTTTCEDQDPTSCQHWHTAGALGGFITLNEANSVYIQDLGGKSLCVELTSGSSTSNGGLSCATDADGNVLAKGDFCSTTNAPGGCQDSYWLAATFAASAAKITAGTNVPACSGGAPLEAGVGMAADASDAGGDAVVDGAPSGDESGD